MMAPTHIQPLLLLSNMNWANKYVKYLFLELSIAKVLIDHNYEENSSKHYFVAFYP